MTKNKKVEFLMKLDELLTEFGSWRIKIVVGDSTDNNRTASVNQTIKALQFSSIKGHRRLGQRLVKVYAILRPTMAHSRKIRGSRTDAFDLRELHKTLMAFIAAEQVAKAVELTV